MLYNIFSIHDQAVFYTYTIEIQKEKGFEPIDSVQTPFILR